MSRRNSKLIKYIVTFGIISATTAVGSIVPVSANENVEAEFSAVMDKYKNEEVVVDEGVSLRKGETLNLSKNPNWEMSDSDTVKISEDGIVTPVNSGTVFLSQKIDDKVHILEVYVPQNKIRAYSFAAMPKVDRDHYKVFVDPGHGGEDSGAVGHGNYEDELNLQVANKVRQKLEAKGIEVKMSRTSDEFISLGDRAKMANSYAPDVFVSIHQNSADATSANGIETYYHTNKSDHKPYAQDVQTKAIGETNARNRGVKSANFAVLRETNMPAALFESGFITNQNESANLASSAYQDKLATGIANGVEKYLKENIEINGSGEKPVDPEQPSTTKTGVVTATSLNVRSGYGTSYGVIGSISNGAKVEIVESKDGWYKIKYNGGYGYVSGDYIKVDESTTPPTNPGETVKNTGVVTATSLNVRSGYGSSYSKIGTLSNGAKVEIVESKDGWYKIKYNGGYGYVSGDYIKVDGSTTPPTNPGETVKNTGVVTATSLNVRSGYGSSYSKIGTLSNGAKVEIVESKNGWHKIKYNGGYGYVSGDYIKVDGSTTPPTNPGETVKNTGVVTATSLNVRSGYGSSYSKIGTLSNGAKVEIVESKDGWHKIKYNGGYGYVSGDYIKVDGSTTPPTNPGETVKNTGVVTATSLNVRSGYGSSYSKIGTLSNGAKVEIVESKNGWHKIKYNGGYGYVSGDYIKIGGSTTNPPSTTKTGVVTATSLNVRSGYGSGYSKIGTLSNGAKVEIVESKNGWHKIKYNGGYGYVSGDYIKIG
ncbi:N-acetylmuramoyl-L-alanine amidase [Paraclostridium bifermentans]|uniref:N-acetylmuramoyl-L-alanine amidase n=5 Tax=Paraclostridium bifermentans TaxID=1490 RepID=UPI0011DDE3E0|nr:N-acetylmuramoyl-L-alanine amidase [Paraclostridium bifermentans]